MNTEHFKKVAYIKNILTYYKHIYYAVKDYLGVIEITLLLWKCYVQISHLFIKKN